MEDQKQEIEIKEDDTYKNDDVETIKQMQAKFDAELAKRDQKYSALLKFATEGGKVSAEKPAEPTDAEIKAQMEDLAKQVRDNKMSGLEQAKALLAFDEYKMNKLGGRSIFAYTDGDLDRAELESIDKVKGLLQHAIEVTDGDPGVFEAAIASKLVDKY